jgi:hypothetical protein
MFDMFDMLLQAYNRAAKQFTELPFEAETYGKFESKGKGKGKGKGDTLRFFVKVDRLMIR